MAERLREGFSKALGQGIGLPIAARTRQILGRRIETSGWTKGVTGVAGRLNVRLRRALG
jgi:hypothetical protein